jgi:Xaa-Pro aminopeptidase
VDSGGQYHNGTTDITRTIALGEITKERKTHYTAVLKGHIALAMANFEKGTTGAQLDEIARKPIKELGLNFNHGTGHGVGHLLSVHEGPNTISPRGTESQILPGMITSNEPGLYFEGKYGIRIENEILCYEEDGICKFESITLCPYEKDAIDMEMLTDRELDHINNYHKKVYELVSPLVDEETKAWLDEACAEIQR